MATSESSDVMPRRPRRFHRVVPCFLMCAAWLVVFDALHRLSFVQGVARYGTRAAERQVAQRFSRKRQQTPGQRDEDGKSEARRLTKRVLPAWKVVGVLDWAMRASAAYTQLERLKRKRDLQQRDWDSPVPRVEEKGGLSAREMSMVLWGLAQLSERYSMPTKPLAAFVKSVTAKVKSMNAFDLSNCMCASAKLKDVAPEVLQAVPALVTKTPNKSKGHETTKVVQLFVCVLAAQG